MFVLANCAPVCVCVCKWVFGKCVMGRGVRSFAEGVLSHPALSPLSGEHNPYMTLSSWLTVPPSRLFHPTENNIVHLPPPVGCCVSVKRKLLIVSR